MTGKSNLGKVITVTILSLVFLLGLVSPVPAATAPEYYYYRVQSGDSLYLIGWQFETTADSIQRLNNLQTTQILIGQVLKIPKFTVPVRPLPKTTQYIVKQGDTLYLVGQKFGLSAAKLIEVNGLSGTTIYPGQNLTIPLPAQKRYVVQSGDTLALLGQRFGATIEALKIVNKMNSYDLWIGQVLFVPDQSAAGTTPPPTGTTPPPTGTTPPDTGATPPTTPPPADVGNGNVQIPAGGQWGAIPPGVVLYHVQSGETLWGIAKRYNSTIQAITETNHLHFDWLQINQPLFILPNSTQAVTISDPIAPQKEGFGEYMDWEYVSWILDTHNTATIKDLDTGKTFRVYRYGGANHGDMEPLTAGDTKVMKEIFGGEWSWNRRAVLVYVGSHVIAASMAGMPHSYDSIPDNDFSGHFDLHFLNSKTHSTDEIDPLHQDMVKKAAGY